MFHLHGHHFRLLDRLDDGWKPFWLDTLAINSGQTQRIAFAAEHAAQLADRGCRHRLGGAAPRAMVWRTDVEHDRQRRGVQPTDGPPRSAASQANAGHATEAAGEESACGRPFVGGRQFAVPGRTDRRG